MSDLLNKLVSEVRVGHTNLGLDSDEKYIFFGGKVDKPKILLILFGGESDSNFSNDHIGLLLDTEEGINYIDKYGTRKLSSIELLDIRKGLCWDILVPEKYKNYNKWDCDNVGWLIFYPKIEELTMEEINNIVF